jgi:hypothetical protein
MTTFEKTLSALLVIGVIAIGTSALYALIQVFFIGLGYLFNYPAESLIAIILIGIAISFIPTKNETLSK